MFSLGWLGVLPDWMGITFNQSIPSVPNNQTWFQIDVYIDLKCYNQVAPGIIELFLLPSDDAKYVLVI